MGKIQSGAESCEGNVSRKREPWVSANGTRKLCHIIWAWGCLRRQRFQTTTLQKKRCPRRKRRIETYQFSNRRRHPMVKSNGREPLNVDILNFHCGLAFMSGARDVESPLNSKSGGQELKPPHRNSSSGASEFALICLLSLLVSNW